MPSQKGIDKHRIMQHAALEFLKTEQSERSGQRNAMLESVSPRIQMQHMLDLSLDEVQTRETGRLRRTVARCVLRRFEQAAMY